MIGRAPTTEVDCDPYKIAYRTGLIAAYAQHLNALEMTLLSGAEQKTRSGSPTGTQEST
jgi:hypothetical protein